MVTTLSIRDLTRSGQILADYDYIDIEDKKSHQYKGVFVPQRHAEEVKAFLQEKIDRQQQAKKNALLQFAGIVQGDFGSANFQDLKRSRETSDS